MIHTLQKILIYPIKSCCGIELPLSNLGPRGLEYDRRYMLVDEDGLFISQRKFPQMAMIRMRKSENGFIASYVVNDIVSEVLIPFYITEGNLLMAQVWDDTFEVIVCENLINAFFSDYLAANVRLVYLPDSTNRYFDTKDQSQFGITSLADAYPLLLIGSASLEDLNAKLLDPVGMERFRPNFIIETNIPFEEDFYSDFQIGIQNFIGVKQCSRCVMTTVDPIHGTLGKEPLKTLASYRSIQSKIMFGMNVAPILEYRHVAIGDKLTLFKS